MASKYFLVFRGRVSYVPRLHVISCLKDDTCFSILINPETKVTIKGSRRYYSEFHNSNVYYGEELLSNGKRYWVRLMRDR